MRGWRCLSSFTLCLLVLTFALSPSPARAEVSECFDCHDDPDFERDEGAPGELHVDPDTFTASVHGDMDCSDCHADAETEDDVHDADLAAVNCADCHEDAAAIYAASVHGEALARNDPDAPTCASCHGRHNILPPSDKDSMAFRMNVPATCSQCHSEAKGLADRHDIGKRNVVETYSMSLHGTGVFKRGLIGAAVCTDCHGSHLVLPHENPKSSIHHDNVAGTCQSCHVNIENVHVKVIDAHLWQEKPDELPACVDCHSPHKVRRAQYRFSLTDGDCMACHGKTDLVMERDGEDVSLFVDQSHLYGSAHAKLNCVMCHANVFKRDEPPCLHTGEVDCSSCHADVADVYEGSIHGKLSAQGNPDAPACVQCHGTHQILARDDRLSPVNIRNIPDLCARCHREGETAAQLRDGSEREIVSSYRMSVHGKGLLESGLLVTAVCTSCHTSHGVLPKADPLSSVHHENIAETCASCHAGIHEEFQKSIHSSEVSRSDEPLPACNDCHSSHRIGRVDSREFRSTTSDRCGGCHEDLTEAYFETYHGKVSLLGEGKTAKCADCHSAHSILPVTDKNSTLSRDNIVATCSKCHEGAHRQFAGYLTHATHKDPDKYPILYYTFWGMTSLLLGTFSFFGLHTLLWLPRSIREMKKRAKQHEEAKDEPYVRRFITYHRVTHLLVIVSFLTLATTGMMLKFSYTGWAQAVSRLLGGFERAGTMHRLAAIVTLVYFVMHVLHLRRDRRRQGMSWAQYIFHPESALFNLRDLKEFGQTLKWFVGRGPRPAYGRYTYWEKFDYFAVFWGVTVIGMSGLMLWFPEAFTLFMPGWALNVAAIIHSDEALLAAGFIFTVHFFNTHFRPERFPMDPVIFTGSISMTEFKEERPREYQQAVESGELEKMLVPPPSKNFLRSARIFGLSMLVIGISLVLLIIYAVLIVYR